MSAYKRRYVSSKARKRRKIYAGLFLAALLCAGAFLIIRYLLREEETLPLPSPSPSASAPPPATPEPQPSAAPEPQEVSARDSYYFDISLRPESGAVECVQRTIYNNRSSDTLEEIVFRMFPNALTDLERLPTAQSLESACSGAEFERILADGERVQAEIEGKYRTTLHIPLPQPLAPGEQVELLFTYSYRLPAGGYTFGKRDKACALNNFYPVAASYQEGEWVLNSISTLDAPWSSEAADFSAAVSLPSSYQLSTSGRIDSKEETDSATTYYVSAANQSSFALAAETGKKNYSETKGLLTVSAYCNYNEKARAVAALAFKILDYYQPTLGSLQGELEIMQYRCSGDFGAANGLILLKSDLFGASNRLTPQLEQALAEGIALQWLEGSAAFDRSLAKYLAGSYYSDVYSSSEAESYFAGDAGASALLKLRIDAGAIEFDQALSAYLAARKEGPAGMEVFAQAFDDPEMVRETLKRYFE